MNGQSRFLLHLLVARGQRGYQPDHAAQFSIEVFIIVDQNVNVILYGQRLRGFRTVEDVADDVHRMEFVRRETHIQRWNRDAAFATGEWRRRVGISRVN